MQHERVLISTLPFDGRAQFDLNAPWHEPTQWPCKWIAADPAPVVPRVVAYQCAFNWKQQSVVRVHVTADESYELFLDGLRIGEGPEHGDKGNWFFDTFDVDLSPGRHVLAALVKQFGPARSAASITVRHGLLCAPEDATAQDCFGTGIANWQAAPFSAIRLTNAAEEIGGPAMIGPAYEISLGEWSIDWALPDALPWRAVRVHESGNCGQVLYPAGAIHLLRPATLPQQRSDRFDQWIMRKSDPPLPASEASAWISVINQSGCVTVAGQTKQEILFDNQAYLCAHAELEIEGGRDARIELAWAEMIRGCDGKKGNRDNIDGDFRGLRDVIIADGSRRRVRLPQWRPGRYLEIRVTTASDALTVRSIKTLQTGYPLHEGPAQWQSGDGELDQILNICRQTQLACAHDMYLDCPFYEQLQYVGDVHMQSLVTYCLTSDARLVRKAIELFFASRHNPSGLPLAAYPSHTGAIIAPFALVLVSILHDYALWREDRPFVSKKLPVLRGVVDWFLAHRSDGGLLRSPFGWNFIDANLGQIPPGGMPGEISGLLNWQFVGALTRMGALEREFGEPELAARYNRIGAEFSAQLQQQLFDRTRGAFLDATGSQQCSEHGQSLALLSGQLSTDCEQAVRKALIDDTTLVPTGAAFTHYLFEVYQKIGCIHQLVQRLEPWRWAIREGFRTFPEYIGLNTRSDCHAWSAHPLYHYFASILGIRPMGWGFKRVLIAPQLPADTDRLSGTMAHPNGPIELELQRTGGHLTATIMMPPGLDGEIRWAGRSQKFGSGHSTLQL